MKAPAIALVLAIAAPSVARAQHFSLLPAMALVDYREQDETLRFTGIGWGVQATGRAGPLVVEANYSRATLSPAAGKSGGDVTLAEWNVIVGAQVAPPLRLEAGITRRTPTPELGAQAVRVYRLGARGELVLIPGTSVHARAHLLVSPAFSGGADAPPGVALGAGFTARLGGPVALQGAYEMQRLDRAVTTGAVSTPLPIQQTRALVGVAVTF